MTVSQEQHIILRKAVRLSMVGSANEHRIVGREGQNAAMGSNPIPVTEVEFEVNGKTFLVRRTKPFAKTSMWVIIEAKTWTLKFHADDLYPFVMSRYSGDGSMWNSVLEGSREDFETDISFLHLATP